MTALPRAVERSDVLPHVGQVLAGHEQVEQTWLTGTDFEEIQPDSEVLRTKSEAQHGLGDLYPSMREKNGQMAAMLDRVDGSVLGLGRRVEPGDPSPKAAEAARMCAWTIDEIDHFDVAEREILKAPAHGSSFVECPWDFITAGPWRGAVLPVDAIDRPMRRFAFERKSRALHIRKPFGEWPYRAPAAQILSARSGTKDNPWGRALLDRLYPTTFLKQHGLTWWSVLIERFANPRVWMGYEPTGDKEKDDVQLAESVKLVEAFMRQAGLAGPNSIKPGLIESQAAGNTSYEAYMQFLGRIEALQILLDIQTAGTDGSTGAYASWETSVSLYAERVKERALFLREVMERWFKTITRVNFGPDVAPPRYVIELTEAVERKLRMDGLQFMERAGIPISKRYIHNVTLAPEPESEEDTWDWTRGAQSETTDDETGEATDDESESDDDDAANDNGDEEGDEDDDAIAAGDRSPTIRLSDDQQRAADDGHRWAERQMRELDSVRDLLRDQWTQRAEAQLADVEGAFESLLDGGELGSVITPEHAQGLADLLHAGMAHGQGLAASHLLADGLPARLWQVDTRAASDGSGATPGGLLDLPLQDLSRPITLAEGLGELGDLSTGAAALEWWAERLSIDKRAFLLLDDESRRLAFSVAGIEQIELLLDVHELLGEALASGMDRKTWRERLADVYRRRGVTPTSDWHADLVLANNLRQTHSAMRWQQTVGNPRAHALIPYLRFHHLGDSKVRRREGADHHVMGERIFAVGHEIWRVWWYPAGHGCRCYVELITRAEAERLGLTGAEPTGPWPQDRHRGGLALPDDGFRAAPPMGVVLPGTPTPSTQPGPSPGPQSQRRPLDVAEEGLYDAVERARRSAGADPRAGSGLLSAMTAILTALFGRETLRRLGLILEGP